MFSLLQKPSFLLLTVVAFINAWVDLGHKIVIQNTVFEVYDGPMQVALTGIANALILLPYALLLSPSGFVSDRYRKHHVLQILAFAAVVLTALITWFYWLGWFWASFAMTLALACQAALYSPAKLGYMREKVATGELAAANGILQASGTVAILVSMLFYSVWFERYVADMAGPRDEAALLTAMTPIGWSLVVFSLLEWLLTLGLPSSPHQNVALKFDFASYRKGEYFRENFRGLANHHVLWWSTVGLAVFWALAQGLIAVYPSWAEDTLAIKSVTEIQFIVAASSIGIVSGALAVGALSAGRIDLGYVPVGAAGITLSLLVMPFFTSTFEQFLLFASLGFFGGLFIVPLESLIQFHAPPDNIGRLLAASNVVRNIVMIGLLALTVVAALVGMDADWLMVALMLIAGVGTLYTVYRLPRSLILFGLKWGVGTRYRIELFGLENLPAQGGVLLLGNHVSWLDWAIIILSSPRPVRFVMSRAIYDRWYWRWVLEIGGVVPISPKAASGAMSKVAECLQAGEVVCLFPEGTLSRHGQLNPFKPGFERVASLAQESGAVILPFYLRGLWGSRFSRSGDGLKSVGWARRRRVILALGAPLPLASKAAEVKQAVTSLSISAWDQHVRGLPALAPTWLRQVQQGPTLPAVLEPDGISLSRQKLAAAVLCFAGLLRQRMQGEARVGLLLPPSAGGIIANLSVLLLGRTLINLNYSASAPVVANSLQQAGVKTVLTSSRFMERLIKRGFDAEVALAGMKVVQLEDLKPAIRPWQGLLALVMVRLLPASVICWWYGARMHNDAEAVILFSSGSEGSPKGVVLSHRNLLGNTEQATDLLNLQRSDVMLGCLPLFHAFGLTVTTLLPLTQGLPVATYPDPTDALGLARTVCRHGTTIMCATPTFLRLYTKNPKVHPLMLQSLRLVVSGAERLDPAVREAFLSRFGKMIYEGYGATEASPVVACNVPDYLDPNEWTLHLGSQPGSVGQALPGTSIRIVDPETLVNLPTGEDGLILIGGVQMMVGYLNDPERTQAALVELDGRRWYRTGDKGHLDAEGFLTIVDRYSRFAKIGGEMVSLSAVEGAIRRALAQPELPLVVVAIADVRKGERLIAVVPEEALDTRDETALRRQLLDAGTPPLWLPDAWVAVLSLPLLGSGKTDYAEAKRLALAVVEAT